MKSKLLCLLLGMILAGCGMASNGSIFNTEPYTDTVKDANGRSIAADTQRNWEKWRGLVDPQIASEIAGAKAPGFPTWNEKWVRQFRHIDSSQENAPKYIAYITESRRKAGLPDLEGYPP